MLVSILFVVLGTVVGGLGFRMAERSVYSIGVSRDGFISGISDPEKADRGKAANWRLIGLLLMLLGAVIIACGIYRLFEILLSNS